MHVTALRASADVKQSASKSKSPGASNGQRILVVDDEDDLLELVRYNLTKEGYAVECVSSGEEALKSARREPPDLIVLDWMLPNVDGLEVCRRLRKDAQVATPILMLTARDQLDDKLTGFAVGADDYLVKPFDMPELVARIDALIRRQRGVESSYTVGELTLNVDTMEVTRAGQAIRLSRTLFDILRILMREAPKVVPRQSLERELWGDDPPDSDALRSHLYTLRKAIDKPFDRPLLHTIAGAGYRLAGDDGG